MKKLLLSVFTITTLAGFSQWQPTSIFFQGENLTYAFGNVLACDDGFNTYQFSSTEAVSWSTSGVSGVPSTGIRFGVLSGGALYGYYNDKIYKSTNGLAWLAMTVPTATTDVIKAMCAVNGTVFATSSPASGSSSKIFQLSGTTWSLKATHSGTIFATIAGINNQLWAGTTSTLAMKSTNGGTSFTASNGTLSPSAFYDKYARSLAANSTTMFMGNDGGRIFKSSDFGTTWGPAYNTGAGTSSAISDIFITSSNAILVACDSGFVYSLDGITWVKNNAGLSYTLGSLNDQLLKVTMSANNIIIATKNGKIYYRAASQVLAGIKEIEIFSVDSKAYPNPGNEVITIESGDLMFEDNCEVKVADVLGREISVIEMKNGLAKINVNTFSKGMYTYSVYRKNAVVSKGKLVVN